MTESEWKEEFCNSCAGVVEAYEVVAKCMETMVEMEDFDNEKAEELLAYIMVKNSRMTKQVEKVLS